MTTNFWLDPVSGDWTNAADWSSGAAPSSTDTVTIAAQGVYTVTLYTAGVAAGLILNDAGLLFYDAGSLAVAGTIALQAGTLALAYGTLQGGTLAMAGGLLQSLGGTLSGVTVQGALDLSPADSTLFVQNGLALQGAGGSGAGTVALTGSNASLDCIGSQTLNAASISLGAVQGGVATLGVAHAYGASAGATLTLGPGLWVRQTGGQGAIAIGAAIAQPPLYDAVVNQGTITASGGTLTVSGGGTFFNQGIVGVSGGATLDIASAGFTNTGTVAVSNAVLDFGGTFATALLSHLGNVQLSQAAVEIGGDDVNTGGTLSVGAGSNLGPITLAGTITGGVVADAGGGLTFGPGTGALDGVTYQGTLGLAAADAALTLLDGTSFGTAAVTGSNAALLLQGTETLGTATILLGSASGVAELGTTDPWIATNATTATLGAHVVVRQTGLYAAVDANAQTPIPDVGLSDTLINQGSITGSVTGGTLTLGGYGSFINQGVIAIGNADTLLVDADAFSNTGTITIGTGAVADLGGPPNPWGTVPSWSNTGTIAVAAGTLRLGGVVRTAQLGRITNAGGTIGLVGTLANTGATLTLGAGGTLPALSLTGTIQGGSIADPGSLLSFGGGGTAMLQGVSYTGTLGLTQQGAYLRAYGGLAVNGLVNVTGNGAVLAFQGTQTFNNTVVNVGGAAGAAIDVTHDYTQAGGSTLTLGAGLRINQAGQSASIGLAADLTGDAIVNGGSIAGTVTGGTLGLGGAAFTNQGTVAVSNGDTLALEAAIFANTGTLAVTNAALSIGGSMTLAQLGHVGLTNAAVGVTGVLNTTGTTLTIGTGSTWGQVTLTGTIRGGVVLDNGLGLVAEGNATLDAVSYRGTLNLSRPFQDLNFADTVHFNDPTGTLAGTVFLTGAADRMVATTSETLPDTNLYIGSNSTSYYGQRIPAPELDAGPGVTLTIGLSTTIRTAGTYSTLGDAASGLWTDTIVNAGTVLSATNGCTLTLDSSFFVNSQSMLIATGASIMIADTGFSNTGNISVTPGSSLTLSLYNFYAAPNAGAVQMTNSGTIHMLGGAIGEMTGGGTFPSVPIENLPGGLIQGLGTILAPILNDGVVESKSGPVLALMQGVTGTGTMLIDSGITLELNGAVSSSQAVNFTAATGTLKLDLPLSFGAAVTGFGGGGSLDLANTKLTGVGITNGTLVAATSTGNFFLDTTSALAGEVSAGSDGHTGLDVSYLAQAQGSGVAVITLSQSSMLFWASPVGDEFTGLTWQLNTASIADWGVTDSLDFTDMAGSRASVSYVQGAGTGTLTITDGSKTGHVLLPGTFDGAGFHAGQDPHGGALITYHG